MIALLLACVLTLRGGDGAWTPESLPLSTVYPCRHSRDIVLWVEPGLPPSKYNRYYMVLDTIVPANSVMNVTFDSEVDITLTLRSDEAKYSRVVLTDGDSFALRFDNEQEGLSFTVQGTTPGDTPYLTALSVNGVQLCDDPAVDYLRMYEADKGVLKKSEHPWKAVIRRSKTQCGRPKVNRTGAIENGLAQPGAWPWHTAVYISNSRAGFRYICGGTLISKYFVVTVAHCITVPFKGQKPAAEKVKVILGLHDMNGTESHSQTKKVEKLIVHEDFDKRRFYSDIALIKLSSAATLTSFVQPACVWRSGLESALTEPTVEVVPGWGIDNDNTMPGPLQQALLPIVSNDTCVRSNPSFYLKLLNEKNFCAGYHNNGTGVCNGDSGGGLVVYVPDRTESGSGKESGAWYVRGMASLSQTVPNGFICDPDQYSLFTDVAKFTDWIDAQMAE
ncbi:chymotrypsin-like elastase family member 2A [Bicyclus anynana]|uniref:Chymotrypsin-like elastase family member 2A n=1 Tax=Bicyclus anynana TaxID=110368 RepID=A0A6J1MWG7_BICAN|nr:chymotrypsin-like elastase family member 2A [Bicyclus anynana]